VAEGGAAVAGNTRSNVDVRAVNLAGGGGIEAV
jgi:hypothetical protein